MHSSTRQNFLPLFIICILSFVSRSYPRVYPDASRQNQLKPDNYGSASDVEFFFFDQNLDHFTYTPESYTTFRQRYAIDFSYWGGAKTNSPILAYLGAESPMDSDLSVVGFLRDNGLHFKALLVYIEHRYYGESMPFGSAKEALKNATTMGYFNTAQALADYAEILMHIKDKYATKHSPIIVIGGSYGGMLATWFRLKYPHVAIGALASSAPLLYFEDTVPKYGYFYVVTQVIKKTSQTCYETIRKSWDDIDRVAWHPNGLSILSEKFKTCAPLNRSSDLKDYLESMYSLVVQYNGLPYYSVDATCKAIDSESPKDTEDLLDRIFAGVVAQFGNQVCYDISIGSPPTNSELAWMWQICSELVMPIGLDKQDTLFQTNPFNMSDYTSKCESMYGISPRPHWISAYYGGEDFKLSLRRFGSNIIFSNGLSDPYSVGGVLEDISDTILAVKTNGSHCMDLVFETKEDPKWLVLQRQKEVEIIDSWISIYQNDLKLEA
ncbi:PREDICTED: lysosomal Pro-X carboxypeptidase-like [Tarenaya hassleriana]|uniref:lysosomal Pro-X carboxypeptidase-like n=1 Tax=Tarenaya hassleriana TaxID=28532 RepID=UPI00053C611D|nr:PREDICTED: lysosomal Pro-X carboxypeptidase-like [Tarenaya hassleriana]